MLGINAKRHIIVNNLCNDRPKWSKLRSVKSKEELAGAKNFEKRILLVLISLRRDYSQCNSSTNFGSNSSQSDYNNTSTNIKSLQIDRNSQSFLSENAMNFQIFHITAIYLDDYLWLIASCDVMAQVADVLFIQLLRADFEKWTFRAN